MTRPYLQPAPINERQQLLNEAGTGDLELADAFNRVNGTRRGSPLSLGDLREAVKAWAVGRSYERRGK